MRQYELWWMELPLRVGRRPVMLLTRTTAYAHLSRVLVAEVTTTIRAIPQEVTLGRREGLTRACVANLDAMRTISRATLRERIGVLRASRHGDVKRALGHVLHWPELTALAG
jgi:mRNA interferase MazF